MARLKIIKISSATGMESPKMVASESVSPISSSVDTTGMLLGMALMARQSGQNQSPSLSTDSSDGPEGRHPR